MSKRCPTCGEAVESIFDHVDRECGWEQAELSDDAYMMDLAERLTAVPVMYGTDQNDCDRLAEMAAKLRAEKKLAKLQAMLESGKFKIVEVSE